MKVGVVITIKDRLELTMQTFDDLRNSLRGIYGVNVILVDDGSKEIPQLHLKNNLVTTLRNKISIGIKQSLMIGINYAFNNLGCDVVTNLDNDVRLKDDWLLILLAQQKAMPNYIHSGFHSVNRNRDGSERHKVVDKRGSFWFKESVGGINMMFNKTVYEKYILPALSTPEGNWDYIACRNSMLDNHPICVAVPSLIQHTGIHESSMGHNNELPDVAADWYDLELPDVTLIGVDCNHFDQLEYAAEVSSRSIKFGAIRLLTSAETINPDAIRIDPLTSKEAYNEFIVKRLYEFVDTSNLLIIQGDGYVINPNAWRDNWLEYDYIGATWLFKDNMNVGNGGFSLRSRAFHETIATDNRIEKTYPEDFQLCRTYRRFLEYEYGFVYAPEQVANQFSIEAYGSNVMAGANKYSGQFGFHGYSVDWSGWKGHVPKQPAKKMNYNNKFNLGKLWEEMR